MTSQSSENHPHASESGLGRSVCACVAVPLSAHTPGLRNPRQVSAGDARQQRLRLAWSTALPASWRVQARHPRVAVLNAVKSAVVGLRSTG